ncbi:MAG: hypothetical protein EON54_20270, partial [Alcaligenaceae bacterium]
MIQNIDNDTFFKLLAICVTVAGWFLKAKFDERPKLDAFILSASDHPLQTPLYVDKEPATPTLLALRSHAIVLRNSGNKTAKNVRIL